MASTSSPVNGDRGRRLEHQERAYELQKKGAIEVSSIGSAISKDKENDIHLSNLDRGW
jgi:hypothetical protein